MIEEWNFKSIRCEFDYDFFEFLTKLLRYCLFYIESNCYYDNMKENASCIEIIKNSI